MERTEEIKKIILALEQYWLEFPDLRLGQLISGISSVETKNFDPFYMEDKALYQYLLSKIENED